MSKKHKAQDAAGGSAPKQGGSWAWGGHRSDAHDLASAWDAQGDWYAGWAKEREQAEAKLCEGLNAVCQKVDRIVADKMDLRVRSVENLGTTGATGLTGDRAEVSFDHTELERWARNRDERIALTLETNLHELGHVLYTPAWEVLTPVGFTDDLLPWFNLLEDQRQEKLLTERYPKAIDYFRHLHLRALRRSMIDNGYQLPHLLFPLYWGRRHLFPANFMAKMVHEILGARQRTQDVNETAILVDEFLGLNLRTRMSMERALVITTWMRDQWGDPQAGKSPSVHVLVGRGTCVPMTGGKAPELTDLKDKGLEGRRLDRAASETALAEIFNGGERGKTSLENLSWDLLDEALEKLDADIEDLAKDLRDKASSWMGKGFKWTDRVVPLPEEHVDTAKRLARQFADISRDLAMQEFRRQRRGKLDLRRLATGIAQDDQRLFRRRQKDLRPDAAMAVHVSIDASGSMRGVLHLAAGAAFTICKGAELAGHYSRLTAFSDAYIELKGWHQHRYAASVPEGGGTQPSYLLRDVAQDFAGIKASKEVHNHVLIMITDGEWSDEQTSRALLRDHRGKGIFVILVGINGYDPNRNGKDWPAYAVITVRNIPELGTALRVTLAKIAQEIAGTILRKVARA